MDRITEKKLENKRFKKTEEAIIMAFFLIKDYSNTERFIRAAKISRSTLYRHHETVSQIIPDYEKFILKRYQKTIQKLPMKTDLYSIYRRTLIFIIANKKITQFLYKFGSHSTLEKMVHCLRLRIFASDKITNNEMFRIYAKEVVGIIEQWELEGFKMDEIPSTVGKIMYLTNNARRQLGPITSQK